MSSFLDSIFNSIPEWMNRFVDFQHDLGKDVAKGIAGLGMKKSEFAAKVGMKQSQLSTIIAGNTNLTLKTIFRLEDALGIELIKRAQLGFTDNRLPHYQESCVKMGIAADAIAPYFTKIQRETIPSLQYDWDLPDFQSQGIALEIRGEHKIICDTGNSSDKMLTTVPLRGAA